jgi:hypothetical protein
MYQFFANKIIKSLTEQPPFSDMIFHYEPDIKEFKQAESKMGLEIAEKILPLDQFESFNETVNYYFEKGDYQTTHQYELADRFAFPGSYYRYLNLGTFLQFFENYYPDAEIAFTQAYLLSEKKRYIYERIIEFFNKTNQFNKIKEFQEKYGKPGN